MIFSVTGRRGRPDSPNRPLFIYCGTDRDRTDVSGFSVRALYAFATNSATAPYLFSSVAVMWRDFSHPIELYVLSRTTPHHGSFCGRDGARTRNLRIDNPASSPIERHVVAPKGIEPSFTDRKSVVLAVRRQGHFNIRRIH